MKAAAAAVSHKPPGCHHYLQGLKLQEASAQRSGLPTKVQHVSSEGFKGAEQSQIPHPGTACYARQVSGLHWEAGAMAGMCLRQAQMLSRMDLILVWQGRGAWLVCSLWQRVDLLASAWLTSFLDSGISGAKGV